MQGFGLSSGLGCAVGGGHYTSSARLGHTLNEFAARDIPPRKQFAPGAVIQGEVGAKAGQLQTVGAVW
jgi:hypothetical protein